MKKRKVDLATAVVVNTNYAGEFAGKYCGAALLSADTLDRSLVTIKPNIKFQEAAKKVTIANVIADATCDFTPVGNISLDDRLITPKELQVNLELCKDPFQKDWDAISMGYSAFDHLPPKFTDYLIGHVGGMVGEDTEKDIWHGTAAAGHFPGYVPMLTADADVKDVAGTIAASAMNPSNIVAELTKLINTIPDAVYRKSDMTLYVANNVARAYTGALGSAGYQMNYWVGEKPLNFNGITVQPVNGLQPGYMVAAEKGNMWFGTGLMSDFNEVRVLDMAMLDGSQNVRIIMRWTAAVQYCVGSDIALYTPA